VSGGCVADGDIDSGLGRAVKDALFGGELSHAFSCHREPVGVVYEAVKNGVSERRVADDLAPLLDRNLAGVDRRSALMTVFEDLEEVALLRLGKDRETPVV